MITFDELASYILKNGSCYTLECRKDCPAFNKDKDKCGVRLMDENAAQSERNWATNHIETKNKLDFLERLK